MTRLFTTCLILTIAGCGTTRFGAILRPPTNDRINQAMLLAPVDATTVRGVPPDQEPARQDAELAVDALVAEVLARNPSLTQMVAAWQAAAAKYPQVRSLDDPMLSGMFAPSSFGSNAVDSGYRIEVSQKIPFPGKLKLRGQGALAEADAAQNDVEDMRVQLIESAKLAFYEFYLVERASAVNDESQKLLNEFKQNAESRFKTGLAPQQDVLQAELEIGRQRERGVTLERVRKVAIARINTLRNLAPDERIAAPPQNLTVTSGLPPVTNLREIAASQRPDLKALQDRIAVEENALKLTLREYYPDVELAAAYDTIMGNGPARDLAPQVGIRMNLPIRMARRNGAVAEAHAKVAQRHAEFASRVNQVQFQVQEAYEQLLESERVTALYEKTILPAARENVKAAQAAYVTGKTPFLSLIEAQRNLVNLRDRNYEATADYFRRRATLERVIGGPIDGAPARTVQRKD